MLTSGEYGPGDLVSVTIRRRVLRLEHSGVLAVEALPGSLLRLDAADVTVERLTPAIEAGTVYRDARNDLCWGMDNGALAWLNGIVVISDVDASRLPLTRLWSPLDADELAVSEDISWPPKQAGLRYRDRHEAECESYERDGEIMVAYDHEQMAEGWSLGVAERKFGPFIPIPASGGASC